MAAIGQPSIATPNAFALKPVQQLADQVRERFRNVEAFAQEAANRASSTGQARDIAALQAQVGQLQLQVAQLVKTIQALTGTTTTNNGTLLILEMDGESGEDGLTIPGPAGPQGEPGMVIMIEGDVDDADFYPPP